MSLLQVASLGVLGMSGYAIYARSQKLKEATDNALLTLSQEISSRGFVLNKAETATNIGETVADALRSMNWGAALPSPAVPTAGKTVDFPSGSQIDWQTLYDMDSLTMMNLLNDNREPVTQVVIDLDRRRVQTTIAKSAVDAVKKLLTSSKKSDGDNVGCSASQGFSA